MMKEKQKEKYTSRNWIIKSPRGKQTAILNFDSSVSFAFVEDHFPGWQIRALFDREHQVAVGKVRRLEQRDDLAK